MGSGPECGGHGPAAQGLGQVARPGRGCQQQQQQQHQQRGEDIPPRPPNPPQGPQEKTPLLREYRRKGAPPQGQQGKPKAKAKPQAKGKGKATPPQTPSPPLARKGPGPLWQCAGCGGHPVCPLEGGGQWGDRQPSDSVGG